MAVAELRVNVRPLGRHALLAEVATAEQALALALWARAEGVKADEIVPAARTVLFDGVEPATVQEALRRWSATAPAARGEVPHLPAAPVVEVPTVYDGADLEVVATAWGCSIAEVITRHTSIDFTSMFCGFAPGFAYLAGLPTAWAVRRHSDPRARVPAGSVALGGTWCGVYPTPSPGGWMLLGRTDLVLWDLEAAVPATLAPGTRVRFVAVR